MFRALFLLIFMTGCQTTAQKNLNLFTDRSEKLRPLSKWQPTWCEVETHLTQPAAARYREMFPDEAGRLNGEPRIYTWKATQNSCEIIALVDSPLTKNHRAFLETALCVLLQAHWVNSPFAGLTLTSADLVTSDERVHIRTSPEPELGIYLDPSQFTLETRTKKRGVLSATYAESFGEWRPQSLEQTTAQSKILINELEFDSLRLGSRPLLKSFWISVGEKKLLQHSHVVLSSCQNY